MALYDFQILNVQKQVSISISLYNIEHFKSMNQFP